MEYATIDARLATYEPPTKRSKLGWPHKTPTPTQLAEAGFYHKPLKSSNDNTICYLCERQLGGWEPDDDPVEEHLKHSPKCGWALLMNAAQDKDQDTSTREDPTGQLLADARRATFSIGWPHESKRAWRCKTEKMVEAGWHFAPVAEGEDYVSCAYCKLSLDGWEPKDDPFEEHHKRSPDCVFFHFAGTTVPAKRPKAKKGRASKASRTSKASTRLSTLSNTQDLTIMSEVPSVVEVDDIPDLEDSIDATDMSTISVMSTASTATTKGKRKGAGGRAKTIQAKKAKTTRNTRPKKAEPEPEPMEEPEIPAEGDAEAILSQPMHFEVEIPASSIPDPLPSPATTSPAEVGYPIVPQESTPPGISNSPHRVSPIHDQESPTPVKTRSQRSSTARPPPRSAQSIRSQMSACVQPSEPQQPHHSSPAPSPSTSDIENLPPSSRSPTSRPPPPPSSLSPEIPQPAQPQPQAIPLTTTPPPQPSPSLPTWIPSDIETIFLDPTHLSHAILSPARAENNILHTLTGSQLSESERAMSVQEWIEYIASQAEGALRMEAERMVGVFEREGGRAMGVLEGIACV